MPVLPFAELSALSNFTFLKGASHPEELVRRGALLGLTALAIADENSVAGIVRAHVAAREITREGGEAPRVLPATRLMFCGGCTVTMLPKDRAAWGRLCRLLTLGRLRAAKGACELDLVDLIAWGQGSVLLVHPTDAVSFWAARRLKRHFGADVFFVMAPLYDGQDRARFARLQRLGNSLGIGLVASAQPLMHHGARRKLADVLCAIRLGLRVDQLGRHALAHAERRLRSGVEIARLFIGHESAVAAADQIAQSLHFSLDELRYEYPSEEEDGETAPQRLARLVERGLAWRYPAGAPNKVRAQVAHELALIGKLRYEPYFLTVRDIVDFARQRGILCQGRGSAANSIVCYALGVTSVSPEIGTMVFERFVSEARDEPPDIDVDFEHERREEVIQHIYARYGRHRAGLCATVIHYRGKRAVREVGRAMGLAEDTLSAMSSQIWGWGGGGTISPARLREIGLDPNDKSLSQALVLIAEIQGFPRHLSQHVGGFIITQGRLDSLVPIENATMEDRTVICWDKGDIDALGILKIDILALGMLTCLRKAFDLLAKHHGLSYDLASLPAEDRATYDMLCRADSLGVFQVESRAQMNFLPRMRPLCFYDLVIQVAIIRPGPIQGDMVHPYLRRRTGAEPVSFPSDALGRVLGKTLGVPLFQEQAMQIAIIGAGFSPLEADRLRRALATFKKHGNVSSLKERFLAGMATNGYDGDFAARCFSQIEGFGSYGFPESHAASFALLVYASAWIKCHHPAVFACALLNAQPMGFYAPAQIVRDAHAHGVELRPVCINSSQWDHSLEPIGQGKLALRLGLRQIKGLSQVEAQWLIAARGNGYQNVQDLWRRAGLSRASLTRLAEADAFAALDMTRRDALWAAKGLADSAPLPLFGQDIDGEACAEPNVIFAQMALGEQVVEDYVALRLTLRAHPMALLRPMLTPKAPSATTIAPS